MNRIFILAGVAITICLVGLFGATKAFASNLELVSSRDGIEGSFTSSRAVWANPTHIFLVSHQGTLFVLERSAERNFPVVSTQTFPSPLTAVRGDGKRIYVSSLDGNMYVLNASTFSLLDTVNVAPYGLSSIEIRDGKIYVAAGQTAFDVDNNFVYMSSLNEGDVVYEIERGAYSKLKTFGTEFEPNITVVYDRLTGSRVRTIENPKNIFGEFAHPSLYTKNGWLYSAATGCCGEGVTMTNARGKQRFLATSYANTTHVVERNTFIGTEAGSIAHYFKNNFSSSFDLRETTGHTGGEDIEIRALWADRIDNLIFAASSWGNDETRSASLPSFFVLTLAE